MARVFALLAALALGAVVYCGARLADSSFAQAAGVLALSWRDGSVAGVIYGTLLGLTVFGMGLMPLLAGVPLAGVVALPARHGAQGESAAPGGLPCWGLCMASTAAGWAAGLAVAAPQPSPYDARGAVFVVLTGASLLLVASAAACAVWGALTPGRWGRLYRALRPTLGARTPAR